MNDNNRLMGQTLPPFSAADVDALPQTVYPIGGFDQLLAVIGVQARLLAVGREVAAEDAAHLIPAYYFPISTAADFKSKLADLAEFGELSEEELYEEWAQRVNQDVTPVITDCWS